jgi:GNAT superfamily N-acetyltransferase
MHREARRAEFLVSTDPALIDLDLVHRVLTNIYWSEGIPKDTVRRGIEGSITFGVYDLSRAHTAECGRGRERGCGSGRDPAAGEQVGFARVITDKATFAYLSDVFIVEAYRGRGLSKWLVEVILAHPDLQGLRRFCLLTRDAHGLYERYGFKPLEDPERYMEIWDRDVYRRGSG